MSFASGPMLQRKAHKAMLLDYQAVNQRDPNSYLPLSPGQRVDSSLFFLTNGSAQIYEGLPCAWKFVSTLHAWQMREWKLRAWRWLAQGHTDSKLVEPEVNFETACFSSNFNYTILCSFEGNEQVKEGEGNLPVTPEWLKEAQESLGNEDWVVLSEVLRALEKQPTRLQ